MLCSSCNLSHETNFLFYQLTVQKINTAPAKKLFFAEK